MQEQTKSVVTFLMKFIDCSFQLFRAELMESLLVLPLYNTEDWFASYFEAIGLWWKYA